MELRRLLSRKLAGSGADAMRSFRSVVSEHKGRGGSFETARPMVVSPCFHADHWSPFAVSLDLATGRLFLLKKDVQVWAVVVSPAHSNNNTTDVLMVGCGTSRLPEAFDPSIYQLTLLDAAPTCIEALQRRYQTSNYRYIVGDAVRMDRNNTVV